MNRDTVLPSAVFLDNDLSEWQARQSEFSIAVSERAKQNSEVATKPHPKEPILSSCVAVKTAEQEVDADVGENHRGEADDGNPSRPRALPSPHETAV